MNIWDTINPYLLNGAMTVVGLAITAACGQFFRLTGIQVSSANRDEVRACIATGVRSSLGTVEGWIDSGLSGTGRLSVLASALTYVKRQMGPVLASMGIDEGQLTSMVTASIVQHEIAAAIPGGSAAVESPVMENAARPGLRGGK